MGARNAYNSQNRSKLSNFFLSNRCENFVRFDIQCQWSYSCMNLSGTIGNSLRSISVVSYLQIVCEWQCFFLLHHIFMLCSSWKNSVKVIVHRYMRCSDNNRNNHRHWRLRNFNTSIYEELVRKFARAK